MRSLILLLGCASCLAAPPRPAPDPARVVNETWGERIRLAIASSGKADDIDIAGQMVASALATKNQPALAVALAERAADLAERDPAGFDTAIKALDVAIAQTPEAEAPRRAEFVGRAIALRQRALATAKPGDRDRIGGELVTMLIAAGQDRLAALDTAGAIAAYRKALAAATGIRDERTLPLRESIEVLIARQRSEAQLELVKARLLKAPGDQAAIDELVQLCIVELDDASLAKPVLASLTNETDRRMLTLADKPVGTLTEIEARELGAWCRGLARNAAPAGKAAVLARAQAAYGIYLARHGEKDAAGQTARQELNEIDAALQTLPLKPSPLRPRTESRPDPWRDYTTSLNRAQEWTSKAGNWTVIDGRIRGKGDARFAFSRPLPQDFTLELTMNVIDGRRPRIGFTGLDFFVGNEGTSPAITLLGPGITDVKGSPIPYINGKELKVSVTCAGEVVTLQIDGKPAVTAKRKAIKESSLELRPGDNFSAGTTEFHHFRLTPAPPVAKAK